MERTACIANVGDRLAPVCSLRVEIFVSVDFFLQYLTIGLIQKIIRVPHILLVICFIIVGILNFHYPFTYNLQ
jgi:hypothetical protein